MTRNQFHVIRQGNGAPEFAGLAVLPVRSFAAEPCEKVGFGGPFASGLQLLSKVRACSCSSEAGPWARRWIST